MTATFEEFKEYMSSLEDGEMNKDELKMVLRTERDLSKPLP